MPVNAQHKKYVKENYKKETFGALSFYEQFGFSTRKDGEDAFRLSIDSISNNKLPKELVKWTKGYSKTLDAELSSTFCDNYWLKIQQDQAMRNVKENAYLEQKVYYSTRKRTLTEVLSINEAGSEPSQRFKGFHSHSNDDMPSDNSSSENDISVDVQNKASVDVQDKSSVVVQDKSSVVVQDETSDITNECTFISLSSQDSSFIAVTSPGDIMQKPIRYVLCFDEITTFKEADLDKCEHGIFDSNMFSFEDVIDISHMKLIESGTAELPEVDLDQQHKNFIHHFNKVILRKSSDFFVQTNSAEDLRLAGMLSLVHSNITDSIIDIQKVKNHEDEFKIKFVVPFFTYIFQNDFSINWDVPSNCYKDTYTSLFAIIRPDMMISSNSTELGCLEVKPFNADVDLIELDKVRVAELTKKQLHKRMTIAKSKKEFITFGITVVGETIELYSLKHSQVKYPIEKLATIPLPTLPTTYPHMATSLEVMLSFKELINMSLPTVEDSKKPYIHHIEKTFLPTTLYYL